MATPFRLKRSAISGKRPEIGDLQLGELALNFYDGYLFAKRDTGGVGIADTVSLLTPWTENYGGESIFYERSVGIGTTTATGAADSNNTTILNAGIVTANYFYGDGSGLFNINVSATPGGDDGSIQYRNNLIADGASDFYYNDTLNRVGIGTTIPTAKLEVIGGVNATGIITATSGFSGNSIDITGHTETDTLNVSGVSTFASDLDINASIDVDGHTELDELNVTGVSTFNAEVKISGSNVLSFNNSSLNISHTGTNANIFNGAGDLIFGADGNKSIKLERVGVATLALFKHGGAVELYYNGSKKLETTNEGILVSGLTTTGTLSVTGVSTFSGNVDINADLDIDGHTELNTVNVSGASTFVGLINANDGLYINNSNIDISINGQNIYEYGTRLRLDTSAGVTIRGGGVAATLASFNYLGSADLYYNNSKKFETTSAGVTVNGTAETQQLNVTGVSTFASAVDINSNVDISGYLDVDGFTELDGVNISETLNVVGVSTFVGLSTFQSNLFASGSINSATAVNVNGVSVIQSAVDEALALAIALG